MTRRVLSGVVWPRSERLLRPPLTYLDAGAEFGTRTRRPLSFSPRRVRLSSAVATVEEVIAGRRCQSEEEPDPHMWNHRRSLT